MNYGAEALMRKSIYKWHKSFAEIGCISAKKKTWGRRPTDETVECVRALFLHSAEIHKVGKQGVG
jgi:hypothetical protein